MGLNFLILTIYFICVVYVLYQIALSAEAKKQDLFEITLDQDAVAAAVNAQLQQQTLYQAEASSEATGLKLTFFQQDQPIGGVQIAVSPLGKQTLEPPVKTLNVNIMNALSAEQVLINWDHSSLSIFGQPAQRVIRQVPGQATDLLHPQVWSVVNPQAKSVNAVTGETLLRRPDNQYALSLSSALVDFSRVESLPEPMRQYGLQLVMWVRPMAYPNSATLQILIPFIFHIKLLPNPVALPVLSWLLNINLFSESSPRSR
jgi:hypothetical protein